MKDDKTVVDSHPCNGVMAKTNKIQFHLGRELSVSVKARIKFRLGLVQISIKVDKTSEGEIFRICASVNIAIKKIEMTKLEINENVAALQPGSSHFFSDDDDITKYEVEKSHNSPSFIVFHYSPWGDVDMVNYTTCNTLFHAKIESFSCIRAIEANGSNCHFFRQDKEEKSIGDGKIKVLTNTII